MRPATVHALAQFLRHTRGCVTTIEKWVAQTPPEVLAAECDEVIFLVRGVLADVNTTLSTAPVPDRAGVGDPTTVDSARPTAARSRA
jgi:hypothetical protein